MPFIFKGGTSLLVMLDNPRRLSTDIDIIVEPGTDVDAYINEAGTIFPFNSVEENVRKGINGIEKRHFRFHFTSPGTAQDINILLDVVFEKNPYLKTVNRQINSKLLLSDGDNLLVTTPDINCILGDKLTAFAPYTTGIPFGNDKELEIIKQLFDCWTLLQEMDDFQMVKDVYKTISQIELGYRGLDKDFNDCLKDTINGCICILGRGSIKAEEYAYYSKGINAIQGHIFQGRLNGENAGVLASEVMYLAASILTGQTEYKRITDTNAPVKITPKMKGIKKISSMKNTNPLAYSHMIEAFTMLNDIGLYTESI